MLNWLQKLFSIPAFSTAEETRLARELNIVYSAAIGIFLGTDALLAVLGYPPTTPTYWIFLGMALAIAVLLVVMRRGHLRQTAMIFMSVVYVGLVISAWTQSGVRDAAFIGLTGAILLSSVLLGELALVVFTILSIIAGFVLAYAQVAGIIPQPADAPVNTAIAMAAVFIADAAFSYLAITKLKASIKRTQTGESDLLERNKELATLQASLEKQVEERTGTLVKANEHSQRRAMLFEALAKITRAATVRQDPSQLLPELANLISEYFGYYHVGIFLLEESGKYAILRATNSVAGNKLLNGKYEIDMADQGLISQAILQVKAQYVLDGDFNYPDLPKTRSEAVLPLKFGSRIIGALDLQSDIPAAFPDEDFEFLDILAERISTTIEDSKLFSETTQALSEARTVYGQYLRKAWEQLPQETRLAGFQYTDGVSAPMETPRELPEIQSAFKTGEAVTDTDKSPVYAIPLKLHDQVIGVLDIRSSTSSQWSESQLTLIRAIAERVTLALENARLFEETTRRADREKTVSEITTRIRSVSDPQLMLQTALDELKRALGANHIQIRPYSPPPADQTSEEQPILEDPEPSKSAELV
jgi:GAF domain-containing protein